MKRSMNETDIKKETLNNYTCVHFFTVKYLKKSKQNHNLTRK